eukprot:c24368_g1_i1 orf=492-3809(+)
MDKRNWPWKKKTPDKSLTCTDVGESSPSQGLKPFDNQGQGRQADEKIRRLNERLLAADHLAKQHATVAEEAVSGWEKAKAEYMSVKYELDTVLEQKQAAEVRVFHLDGALKECMQQLRQVREEQEQRIHEAIIKRSREWDKTRLDLEERLAEADRELIEAGNQKNLLYKTVQEQAEAVAELGQIRSQAEAEIKMLQVQIQTLEKENTSLKYEIVVLNKELDIRNQEREINNRSLDMASRQQLEGTKRIAKLEAECQRLRALVRKKLPGPGALLQMKLEAGVDAEKGDFSYKRRSGGRAICSPKAAHADSFSLSERLIALEEETEMLKEVLAKRNKELQSTRLLCSQTTDKLSSLEGQVGQLQQSPRVPFIGPGFLSKEPSQFSMSEDGNDDERSVADSWTSGLIAELAYFQKEKITQQQSNTVPSPKVLERLNSIDDFMEIERLVSLPSENQGVEPEESLRSMSKQVLAKDAELQAANRLCAEVNKKLAIGEEQVSMLRSKNMVNELNLFSLQQRLIAILEAPERGDPEMVLEKLKNAVLASQCSSVDGLHAHVRKLSGVAAPADHSNGILCSSESSHFQESSQVKCYSEEKICNIGPELTSVVCKVVRVVEDLAAESMAQHLATLKEGHDVDSGNSHHDTNSTPKPRPSDLEASVRKFNAVSNQYLYGKAELVQFIAELCSVLSHLKNLNSSKSYSSLASRMKLLRPEAMQVAEQDVFSDVGSPVSLTSNSDGSESLAAKAFPGDDRLGSSKRASLDEDLQKVRAEKAALEAHLRAELSKMATVERMLAKLKQEKAELENKLEEEKDKFNTLKAQLLDSEHLVATLRVRLASAEISGTVAEKNLSSNTTVKGKLEAQLEESQLELTHMREKLKNLEGVIDQEQRRNKELQMKVDELEALRQRTSSSGFLSDVENSTKEQEIADATEKLAECQRTIFVLGRQLKGMVSAQDVGSIATKLSSNQVREDAPEDEVTKHGNTMSTLQKTKPRFATIDPGQRRMSDVTNDELDSFAKSPGPSLEKPASVLVVDKAPLHKDDSQGKLSLLHAEADKQLVKYVPKPATRKKSNLHSFAAIDMSKSLNLDPSASPRRHGSGFSKFFSRRKNP